jgi:hypothetical protein
LDSTAATVAVFPQETYVLLNQIEDEIMVQLKDNDGYLNVGRVTTGNTREIYFVCVEFRKPSFVASEIEKRFSGPLQITSSLYKDNIGGLSTVSRASSKSGA